MRRTHTIVPHLLKFWQIKDVSFRPGSTATEGTIAFTYWKVNHGRHLQIGEYGYFFYSIVADLPATVPPLVSYKRSSS